MVQFYFLSVFLNIACGYALSLARRQRSHHLLRSLDTLFTDDRVRLSFGILSIVTGAFKLISPMRGDVRVIGDLFPAIMGLLAGAVLLLEIRQGSTSASSQASVAEGSTGGKSSELPVDQPPPAGESGSERRQRRLEELLLGSGSAIGFVAMFAGVMHFLFPMELFL
jgi:hypothetical protein